jgi:hypothetical protein
MEEGKIMIKWAWLEQIVFLKSLIMAGISTRNEVARLLAGRAAGPLYQKA